MNAAAKWKLGVGITIVVPLIGWGVDWALTERTARANRAYMTISDAQIFKTASNDGDPSARRVLGEMATLGPLVADDNPAFLLVFQNTGHTPAHDVESRANMTVLKEFPKDPNPDDYRRDLDKLGFGQVSSKSDIGKDGPLDVRGVGGRMVADQVARVTSKQAFLVVYGFLNYFDDYNRERMTMFCRFYDPGSLRLVSCPSHNRVY